VQLPALEHRTNQLELAPPDAQPGSLAAALPALQALEVDLPQQCPAILMALQGHKLLASVTSHSGLLARAASAWPTGGLSSLPALRKFSSSVLPQQPGWARCWRTWRPAGRWRWHA
jgi:hypothetical protein